MQPKVSMVIPCYNKVQWIGAMFDSVLAQQWDNIELILVNDGSTDGTRDVIANYESKFHTRGYEVMVIDQENQGRAAAVKHGLMRITGEYVCMPDCDDWLHPEYVSAMAELLTNRQEYDAIRCFDQGMSFPLAGVADRGTSSIADGSAREFPHSILESILLGRLDHSVCRGMFKARTIKSLNIPDGFVTEPNLTQEYQVWIPLGLHRARVLVLYRVLYHYNRPDIRKGEREHLTSTESMLNSLRACDEIIKKTFISQGVNSYDYYMNLKNITNYDIILYFLNQRFEQLSVAYFRKMLDEINANFFADRPISQEAASLAGNVVLFRFFTNHILGHVPPRFKTPRLPGGRVIAYGALGRAAKYLMSGLINSDIRPDVFWDLAAKPGKTIADIPVVKPDYESLTENDTVLVLLKSVTIAQEVKNALDQTAAKDNVWYFYDVLDYLASYYFTHI